MEERERGRPTKYKSEYCDEMIDYFDRELTETVAKDAVSARGVVQVAEERATDLPLFQDFAVRIGVHIDTLHEWKKVHKEFSEAYKRCKNMQMRHLVMNAMQGRYSNSFAIFTAKNILGWRDKQEVEVESNGGITINVSKDS